MWNKNKSMLLLLALFIGAGGVLFMANKYCNLQGGDKIKDTYTDINTGFDGVDADVSALGAGITATNTRVDTIITTPAEGVSAQEIIDARKGKPSLGAKIGEIDSHLADIANIFNATTCKVKIIAHRGLRVAPENSIPAYELAGDAGFWGAETDTIVTSDGTWVIMHDETVDRTTDGTGKVVLMTLAEIQALTMDAGTNISKYPNLKVPTLEEYLICCKKNNLIPVIEIKSWSGYTSDHFNSFLNLVVKYQLENRCMVISSSDIVLSEIRSRNKNIYMQIVNNYITQERIDFAKTLGKSGIDGSAEYATKESIELAHNNGLLVNIFGVLTQTQLLNVIEWGADYITTDTILWR